MDDAQLASEALGLTRLDEAVVYDPKSFEMIYRGPVATELESSIQRLLNGSDDSLITLSTSGASIEFTGTGVHMAPSYVFVFDRGILVTSGIGKFLGIERWLRLFLPPKCDKISVG
jgi:hypothetical protein